MALTRWLLVCGILGSALFLSMDLLAGTMFYPGYDYGGQQVSELSAIGAPSRTFWITMGYPQASLGLLFTAGVWRAAEGRRGLQIAAVLIGVFALNGLLWGTLAPMHMRGAGFSDTDVAHIFFVFPAIASMVGFIRFGGAAFGLGFRIYSALTVLAMLVAGGVVSTAVPAIAAGEPTPWMGLVERVSVHGPMIWLAVFAAALLRGHVRSSGTRGGLARPPAQAGARPVAE